MVQTDFGIVELGGQCVIEDKRDEKPGGTLSIKTSNWEQVETVIGVTVIVALSWRGISTVAF